MLILAVPLVVLIDTIKIKPTAFNKLLKGLLIVGTVVAVDRYTDHCKQKKMLQDGREFLEQWGHIRSPYHSSLSVSDSSVEELISY